MKILLTGGAGFIASHIQDAYIHQGHKVCVVDNLSHGSKQNLNPQAEFVEMDIRDPEIRKVILDFQPDCINHHAAQMDVRKSVADPIFDLETNVLGLIHILEAAREAKVPKIIFASSGGAVYGEQESFPATEEHPTRPLSPYGLTKKTGEEYLLLYQRLYGITPVILRYANVYGPRQDPHGEAGVIAIFCEKLLANETVTIYGDGEQTRDYVFVGDVVQANLLALNSKKEGTYNIGTGIETTVNELFNILQKLNGKGDKKHLDPRLGEQKRSVITAKKITELGWNLSVSLEQGLSKTWDWIKTKSR